MAEVKEKIHLLPSSSDRQTGKDIIILLLRVSFSFVETLWSWIKKNQKPSLISLFSQSSLIHDLTSTIKQNQQVIIM